MLHTELKPLSPRDPAVLCRFFLCLSLRPAACRESVISWSRQEKNGLGDQHTHAALSPERGAACNRSDTWQTERGAVSSHETFKPPPPGSPSSGCSVLEEMKLEQERLAVLVIFRLLTRRCPMRPPCIDLDEGQDLRGQTRERDQWVRILLQKPCLYN